MTATVLAAEIGDFARFSNPRQLMAYLGLVPSEHSSGSSRRQGGITHAGNRHARWILIEAAWNYRFGPRPSKAIAARRRQVAPGVRTIAEKAEERLHRRFTRLTHRGKKSQAVVTAVARELVGFVWRFPRATITGGVRPREGTSRTPRSLPPAPQPPSPLLCSMEFLADEQSDQHLTHSWRSRQSTRPKGNPHDILRVKSLAIRRHRPNTRKVDRGSPRRNQVMR